MSRAHLVRLAIDLGGGTAAIGIVLLTHPLGLAVALAIPIFLLAAFASDWAFRHLASPEEIRADHEERVRHPP